MLRVSLRTLQNWLSGRHQVPYAVYKLLRMMRYMELPGQSWQGWHFSRGQLVTPEGRTISGNDGSWWSLLVRQSHSFGQLYRELQLERQTQTVTLQANGSSGAQKGTREAGNGAPTAGLVSVSTSHTQGHEPINQDGAIMGPWPTISDFPQPLTPTPENSLNALESASTPCFALPSIPTYGKPAQALKPETVPAKPGQSLPLLSDSWLNRPYLGNLYQFPRTTLPNGQGPSPSSAKPSAATSLHANASPEKASSELVGGAA